MMKASLCVLCLAACCGTAAAQTDVLFVTDPFSGTRLNRFQGGTTLSQTPLNGGGTESALAVAGDVRTITHTGSPGYQYNLFGTYTGTSYPYSGPGTWYDGTTNGTSNFSVAASSGDVYAFDRDWQSPGYLFTTQSNGGFGITYDGNNNSLWVTNTRTNRIEEYNFSGGLLSSFSISGSSTFSGLAWEPSTDTLWLAGNGNSYYEQFSKTGTLLQTVFPSGLSAPVGFYGAEFDVPAPGALAPLGLAGLAATRRRRV